MENRPTALISGHFFGGFCWGVRRGYGPTSGDNQRGPSCPPNQPQAVLRLIHRVVHNLWVSGVNQHERPAWQSQGEVVPCGLFGSVGKPRRRSSMRSDRQELRRQAPAPESYGRARKETRREPSKARATRKEKRVRSNKTRTRARKKNEASVKRGRPRTEENRGPPPKREREAAGGEGKPPELGRRRQGRFPPQRGRRGPLGRGSEGASPPRRGRRGEGPLEGGAKGASPPARKARAPARPWKGERRELRSRSGGNREVPPKD